MWRDRSPFRSRHNPFSLKNHPGTTHVRAPWSRPNNSYVDNVARSEQLERSVPVSDNRHGVAGERCEVVQEFAKPADFFDSDVDRTAGAPGPPVRPGPDGVECLRRAAVLRTSPRRY